MPESALNVASIVHDPSLEASVSRWLAGGRYCLISVDPEGDSPHRLDRLRDDCDALLVEQACLSDAINQGLSQLGVVLPTVVIGEPDGEVAIHEAEVRLSADQLEQLSYSLDAAVSRFLRRGLKSSRSGDAHREAIDQPDSGDNPPAPTWRLDDRLKDRLGLLGVFYKRDPSRFLRNLPSSENEVLLRSLRRTYRDFLVSYFRNPSAANQALESFVNTAFFSDLSITKVVQIHMDLIDSFSKHLKVEGHKSDFLQDYRLALLDVMAHLCEMYRRSIPPDVPIARLPQDA